MSMHWDLDDGLAERRSPTTMYGVDWRGCDLHRQPGSAGYTIGDASALRQAASDLGGVFAVVLAQAMADPDPMPATMRDFNERMWARQRASDWGMSG